MRPRLIVRCGVGSRALGLWVRLLWPEMAALWGSDGAVTRLAGDFAVPLCVLKGIASALCQSKGLALSLTLLESCLPLPTPLAGL